MALSFRSLFRFLLPGNYHAEGTDGEKVLYSLAMVQDILDQLDYERLVARFPSYAGESALALIGADRGIPRGRGESAAAYAKRLIGWRWPRGHRVRGSAYALLEQIWTYFGGGFELHAVQPNEWSWKRDAAGAESAAAYPAWDWDSSDNPDAADQWARFWLVIDGTDLIDPVPNWGDPTLYGGQHGDSSYALGHTGVSADDVNAIRRLFRGRAWKPAGTRAEWAVISLDGSEPVPDGTWRWWAKDDGFGVYEPTRPDTFRYWALDEAANKYVGDPVAYPLAAPFPVSGTFSGDVTSFPASSILPGGFSYGGTGAYYPQSATLVDDGSIP